MNECRVGAHRHNHRCRYTHGFFCEDCRTFFPRDSETYRRDEMLGDVRDNLWNLNIRENSPEIEALIDRIGISQNHDHDYNDLITEGLAVLARFGLTDQSNSIVLKDTAPPEYRAALAARAKP